VSVLALGDSNLYLEIHSVVLRFFYASPSVGVCGSATTGGSWERASAAM
jgi:hypothetical protein